MDQERGPTKIFYVRFSTRTLTASSIVKWTPGTEERIDDPHALKLFERV